MDQSDETKRDIDIELKRWRDSKDKETTFYRIMSILGFLIVVCCIIMLIVGILLVPLELHHQK